MGKGVRGKGGRSGGGDKEKGGGYEKSFQKQI